MTAPSPWPRALDALLAACFIAAISIPGVWMLLKPPTGAATAATGEVHPPLHELLAVDRTPLDTARTLKKWFETRFPLRDRLVEGDALLKVRLLGISTSDSVLVGSDGWLFYAGEQSLDSFRRVRPFSDQELERWRHIIDTWSAISTRAHARLVIMVAPDKSTVYADLMPAWTAPLPGASRLDQLETMLRGRGDVDFVDLRPTLADARRTGVPLYYRTDTHWNDLAGYLAVRELLRVLAPRFPAIVVPPLAANVAVTTLPLGGDLARFLGLKKHLADQDVHVVLPEPQGAVETVWGTSAVPWKRRADLKRDMRIEPHVRSSRPGAPIGRAYVLRDSFGNALVPYLAEHVGAASYRWTEWLDPREVEDYHPDVVIIELAERYLMKAPQEFLTPPPPEAQ